MLRTLPILLLVACGGCRVPPTDSAESPTIDFGSIELGATFSVRLFLDGVDATTAVNGTGLERVSGLDGQLNLLWQPTEEGSHKGSLTTESGKEITLELQVESPIEHWPDPIALETGIDTLGSLLETGMGDAILPNDEAIPIAIDPISGNAFFGDAAQGRAWRMDPFYNHPTLGLWVAVNRETKGTWVEPPDCFSDDDGLLQDGTCNGSELDVDGGPPRGWRFFHGGFAGDGELNGLSSLIPDPDHGRIWALGSEWIQAIDTDLFTTEDEGTNTYSFTQVIENSLIVLDKHWQEIEGVKLGDRLWIVAPETGHLGIVDLPVDDGPWAETALGFTITQFTTDGQSLFLLSTDSLHILTPASGSDLTPENLISQQQQIALPTDLLNGEANDLVAHNGEAWVAFGDAIVHISDQEASVHPLPEGGTIRSIALDVVEGGDAERLEMLYLVGQTNEQGWLRSATLDGAWLGTPISLVDVPLALAHSPEPHDLYVVYASGTAGCNDEWWSLCIMGSHPPVVQVFYNPYSLVPPTSTGHLLNLFLSPIIETPKDSEVGSDFTSGRVCTSTDPKSTTEDSELDLGCCALAWSLEQRLLPNVDYFDFIANLGSETSDTMDDPTLAWGVNPSVLRQAWECANSEVVEYQQTGQAMYETISNLIGDQGSLGAWTHTALNQGEGTLNHDWWLGLAFEEGVDYTLPIDTQQEYALLHEALSLIFVPELLGGPINGIDLSSTTGSGNSLDAADLIDPDIGWPDHNPSWVQPIRDGSLATDAPARNAYYFLSAGTYPSIGMNTYRKKELWPIDVRDRAVVSQLPEYVVDFGQSGTSGLYNLPGLSWELGTLVNLSEGGAYRETQMYGQAVTAKNWEYVFRLLRRAIATSNAEDTKSWYQHIFDVTNPKGLFTESSRVPNVGSIDGDVTAQAILRINTELVEPGYARWSLPEDIVDEAMSSAD